MSQPISGRSGPGFGLAEVQPPEIPRGRIPNTVLGNVAGSGGTGAFVSQVQRDQHAAPVMERRDCMSILQSSARPGTPSARLGATHDDLGVRARSREQPQSPTDSRSPALGGASFNLVSKMEDLQKKLFQILDAERSDRLASFTRVESMLMSMSHDLRPVIRHVEQASGQSQPPEMTGPGGAMGASDEKLKGVEESFVRLQHHMEDKLENLQGQIFARLEERLSNNKIGLPATAPLSSATAAPDLAPLLQAASQQFAVDIAGQISPLTQKVQDIGDAVYKLSGHTNGIAQPTAAADPATKSLLPAEYSNAISPAALGPLEMPLPEELHHESAVKPCNPSIGGPGVNGVREEPREPVAADMSAKLETFGPNGAPATAFAPSQWDASQQALPMVHATRVLSRAIGEVRVMDAELEALKVQKDSNPVGFLKPNEIFQGMDVHAQLAQELGTFGKVMACLHSMQEPERSGKLWDIVDHKLFQRVTIWVIVSNAMFIMYGTNWAIDNLNQTPPMSMLAIEAFFTMYYIVELTLRLLVHRAYFFINEECKWNNLDFALVALSVFDWSTRLFDMSSINLAFLRVVRLLKLAKGLRALRAVRFFKALRLIMDCMTGSVVPFFWCVCFILSMFAIFSLVFVQGVTEKLAAADAGTDNSLTDEDIENFYRAFGSVQRSMLTLLMAATGGDDWAIFYYYMEKAGPLYAAGFLFFVCWFFLAAWNIVTGLFVEQAMKLAAPGMDEMAHEKEQQDADDAKLLKSLLTYINGDGPIHIKQLPQVLEEKRIANWFQVQCLEIKDAETFMQMLAAVAMVFQKKFYASVQQKMNWLIQGVFECATFLEQHTDPAFSPSALDGKPSPEN
eukprot:TRINITY_DN6851_c0_g1_i1.p1 TRINITY_DN6851_c0_g1~~TRINITY_DN6851_c0_g1_i1.p1  ORF type:complete len:873 (-),score=184.42 TRINITY_DN6851_c0_g1_i1:104-2656(-)